MRSCIEKISLFVTKHRVIWVLLLCLPILAFLSGIWIRPRSALVGDWDYFLQMYEAFRQSVLHYHQFPWWNPWVAGGVPLYANPQFGLISIQSPLVLLFGTLYGLKLGLISYYLLGFWGMYLLAMRLSGQRLRSVLLSYMFVFSGFVAFHTMGGQLTFAMYLLVPLLIYFFIRRVELKYGWVWLVLFTAFFINSAPHYIVIQTCVLMALISAYDYGRRWRRGAQLPWCQDLIALAAIAVLVCHKLLYSLQYLHDYPRLIGHQTPVGLRLMLAAMFWPYYNGNGFVPRWGLEFGWGEYSAYIGWGSLLILVGCLVYIAYKRIWRQEHRSLYCLVLVIVGFLLAAGPFARYAPYHVLSKLPIFSSMGVPSRYLGWSALFLLLFFACLRLRSRLLNIALLVVVVDLFVAHSAIFMRPTQLLSTAPQYQNNFVQYTDYAPTDENRYYDGTLRNIGEVHGYEAILGYDMGRPTKRVGVNDGGKMISDNAAVISWSPNRIVLRRISAGPIHLNTNPSSYWLVNGKRIFASMKATEPNQEFVIDDQASEIVCEISPTLDPPPLQNGP
jgi:hypothetical protein